MTTTQKIEDERPKVIKPEHRVFYVDTSNKLKNDEEMDRPLNDHYFLKHSNNINKTDFTNDVLTVTKIDFLNNT